MPAPTDTLVIERRIKARPETVFSFLTDQDLWLEWKGVFGQIDASPGGQYRIGVTGPDHIAAGTFLAIEPYDRVVFSWGWEGEDELVPPGSTVVEITLQPEGGDTVLTLTHRDLPVNDDGRHALGWNHYLDRLVIRAGGGDPGPDEWAAAATND